MKQIIIIIILLLFLFVCGCCDNDCKYVEKIYKVNILDKDFNSKCIETNIGSMSFNDKKLYCELIIGNEYIVTTHKGVYCPIITSYKVC